VSTVVRMPVGVLSPGCGVQIEDRVNSMGSTDVDNTVEVLESGLLEDTGIQVICMQQLDGIKTKQNQN
jgi:hypothetical protein